MHEILVPSSLHHLQHWISVHGYLGIFLLLLLGIFGMPIPDETLLLFCGCLTSRGTLHAIPLLICSFLGSASGISLSYVLGRLLGMQTIIRFGKYVGIHTAQLEKVHNWFKGIGHWTLVVGYFVPGVRHLTALIAGISILDARSFMTYAYLGAFLWVSVFLSLGYMFGEKWPVVSRLFHQHLVLALSMIVAGFLFYLLVRKVLNSRALERGKP